MSLASFGELFPLIKSISYPNNKTKHLIGMAKMLVEKFDGKSTHDRERVDVIARCREENGKCYHIGR